MKNYLCVSGRKAELSKEQADQLWQKFGPEAVKLADFAAKETFRIGEYEFLVLEQFQDSAAVICKGLLHESMVFGDSNNLNGSNVDKVCGTFANEIAGIIGEENLVEFTVDLTSDDGLKDYGMIQRKMSLLTADQYRKYVDILDEHKIGHWWWLATPYSTVRHENNRWVKCVSPSGSLRIDYCNFDSIGVRPFCILKSHIFVSK